MDKFNQKPQNKSNIRDTLKISIIIPTLNEEKAIGKVLREIPKKALKREHELEILLIDGASTDNTKAIAENLGATVITEKRKGYGRAYKAGFKHATGDIIVTADGDYTYSMSIIPSLIEKLEKENLDFITTNRFRYMDKKSMTTLHKIGNQTLTIATQLLFHTNIKDSQSGMWIFRKNILRQLNLESDSMSFSEEIKIEAYKRGFRCREIPIRYRMRIGEVKLKSFKDGIKNLGFLIQKKIKKIT